MMAGWHLLPGIGRQIRRYKLRSGLVIVCAALGVAGATTAVNYASGGREQVLAQIRRLGSSVLTVSAEQSRGVADRARTGTIVTTLDSADYQAIRKEVSDIVRSSALVSGTLRLKAGYLSKVAPVTGIEHDWFAMKAAELHTGGFFGDDDNRRSARVAVLGSTVARDLYGTESPVGERLFINRVPFEVLGVLKERGRGLDGSTEDGIVLVPLNTAMRRLFNIDHYSAILLELRSATHMPEVTREVTALMAERHRVTPRRAADFRVQSQTDLITTQLQASDRLTFLVRWIGRSGLAVAGLGIFAIAWIAVRDRTREIGTRRALGATAPDIFAQFAVEAALLALLGALAGLGLGLAASSLLASQAGIPLVVDISNTIVAFVLALALNLVFASWPAMHAARLDPIQALRHE